MSFDHAFAARADLQKYGNNALLLFALEMRYEIDDIDSVAIDALTDGSDDKKCDLVYIDIDEAFAVIAQGYFSQDVMKKEAPANKASDLNTAAGWLLSREAKDLPDKLRPAATQFQSALKDGQLRAIYFWYVHNLPESSNVKKELATVQSTATAALKGMYQGSPIIPEVSVIEVGRERLTEWYQRLTNSILVTDSFELDVPGGYSQAMDDWSAFVTAIPAKWLFEQFAKYKSKMFSANIRGYLGSRDTMANINNSIKNTASNDPKHLWVFNNGLTVLVNSFEYEQTANKLRVAGLSIVNGAQTTGAIGSLATAPPNDAMVPARFVSCSNTATVRDIIKYNNSQNPVEAPDFRSGDFIQKRLRDEFSRIPQVTYLGGRRGGDQDKILRLPNLLPSDTAGQALAAFHGEPVVAYNEKSQIWISNRLYARFFSERTTARHIVMVFALLRSVEAIKYELIRIDDANLTDSQKEQLQFLRNRGALLLVASAVASCLESVLGRAVPDKFRLSFGVTVSPADAQKLWDPLVRSMIPFSIKLTSAVESGLKSAEAANKSVRDFRSLVEAVKAVNKSVFDTFAAAVVED